MRKFLPLLLLALLISSSCNLTPNGEDEREIRDIIYNISRDFCWNDVNGIMEYVHPDYRHRGMYDDQLRTLWLERRAEYELLQCQVSHIDFEVNYATVHMEMTFQSSTATLNYLEPETNGDASFFYKENGQWQLYGNQLWSSKPGH